MLVQWYADALDLVVDEEGGVESAGFRFVMMKSADGFRLELLSRTGSSAGLRADHPLHAALIEGYGHVALEAVDLDATFERLVTKGATVVWEPRPAPVPGARMAWVKDPEGNLLELLHRG